MIKEVCNKSILLCRRRITKTYFLLYSLLMEWPILLDKFFLKDNFIRLEIVCCVNTHATLTKKTPMTLCNVAIKSIVL